MVDFKNREELLDLLLNDTQNTISEIVKETVVEKTELNINDMAWVIAKLEKLDSKISNYKRMYNHNKECCFCNVDIEMRDLILERFYIDNNNNLTDELEKMPDFKINFCPICGRLL
jgi:N12 class adenine-specific DNA methylase